MRSLVLAALLVALTSWASAQRIIASSAHLAATGRQPSAPPATMVRGERTPSNFSAFREFRHSNPHQSLFYPFGFFSDFSYPDNPSSLSGSPAAQPDLLLQALSALAANQQLSASQPAAKPDSHSLLIELQGERYVNLTNAESPVESPEPTIVSRSPQPARRQPHEKTAATRELMPVMLVFRDGHREDVRDYTIADGVIYARGDFYNDGYWNKKIELSALDLRETVRSNEARGVRFVLPNGPNEVITRP